jgi:hypothetical protein
MQTYDYHFILYMKIGLSGEAKRYNDPNSPHASKFTASDNLPTGRAMTWYKVNTL